MQTISDFQKTCSQLVNNIDTKYDIERDPHFSFVQLMEEIGELAKEINRPKLRHQKIDRKNLKKEFADVALQFFTLAEILKVDIAKAVKTKTKELKQRHLL